MTLLVDAFNVMYKFDDLEEHMHRGELVEARRGLLERLLALRSRWKKPLVLHVFFDGKRKSGDETRRESLNGIDIYYSCDLSADHLIKEFINRAPSTGELVAITSDKDILYHAKKHRCQVKTSEEFAAWVGEVLADSRPQRADTKPDQDLTPEQVEDWMRLFREGERG